MSVEKLMLTIYIDNQPYQVKEGDNLLHAVLSLGLNLPYFCWHPAMGSVGACRQCAVKQFRDENDTRGRLVMACMTPVAEGMRISLTDPQARDFRASVVEFLMVNHPHDCPVCDEGGECHLQDMTVMTGHNYRDYRFEKRTFRNQYLGPFVNHEMNRCIACYRCVRFYRDHAGGHDLDVFAAHDHVYFGRAADGVLESEFSGNLVEVCPTGVFTDKTFKQHYTRKWDLTTAPSVCINCAVGCNTLPGERYDTLRRIRNRYNYDVNGYFLCDRGRYGYEFVNSDLRIRQPLQRTARASSAAQATRESAVQQAAAHIAGSKPAIGIGSPRASLEANFALRALVGPDRFYLGMAEQEASLVALALRILQEGPVRTPSLREIGEADAVLILGEDLTNTAPMIDLAVRQAALRQPRVAAQKLGIDAWNEAALREAIQNQKGPLFIATTDAVKLDEIATTTYRAAPDDLARLAQAVAAAFDPAPTAPVGLADEVKQLAGQIAEALRGAERPVVISGTGSGSVALLQGAANVAWALQGAGRTPQLSLVVPEANSLGLALMGGGGLDAAFQAVKDGKAGAVVILENDLYRRADAASVDAFLSGAEHVVVIDHLSNRTTAAADVVLPAGTFAESDGTLVNNEGRAQRFYQVFVPVGEIQESWRWLRDILAGTGRSAEGGWQNLDQIVAALVEALPVFRPIQDVAPPATFRIAGQKIPRQTIRFSGRTAIRANISVHEPKPPDDPDSPLTFSMEGFDGEPPAELITHFWAPGWNSNQAVNKFQEEIAGPLRGGPEGKRLIEPRVGAAAGYFSASPAAFAARSGEWLLVPLYHIFGSEELSVLSPGVAERVPQPYLALRAEDAARLQVVDGAEVSLTLESATLPLQVRISPALPEGAAGLPVGLAAMPALSLPAWGTITASTEKGTVYKGAKA